MRSLALFVPFVLLAWVGGAVFADEPATPAMPGTVDFSRDVQPIFRKHCYACHSQSNAQGGLALDDHASAGRGGFSGGKVLGGPLSENELWKRVATPEPDYRMPKNGKALVGRDLKIIKNWIEQGGRWTQSKAVVTEGDLAVGGPGMRDVADGVVKRYGWVLLALCIVLLVGIRARKSGKEKLAKVVGVLRPAHVVIVISGLLLFSAMGIVSEQNTDNARANRKLDDVKQSSFVYDYFFGSPPRPKHSPISETMESTYYRGNCERGPHLYNHGRYRTATLHLSLRDNAGRALAVGDAVPEDGMFLRLDIERSPNAAAPMYARDKMASVFLSKTWFKHRSVKKLSKPAYFLKSEKEDWAWSASVPAAGDEDGTHESLYYVYINYREDGRAFSPQVHYGVQADIVIEDGKIAATSDLWLGNLFWNTTMEPPPVEFKLPAEEWLNHDPIPEIPEGQSYHTERAKADADLGPKKKDDAKKAE